MIPNQSFMPEWVKHAPKSNSGVIYELGPTGFRNRSNRRANSPCWIRSSAFSSSSAASFFGVRIFSKLAPSMVFLFFVQRMGRGLGAFIGTSRARFVSELHASSLSTPCQKRPAHARLERFLPL